MGIHPSDTNNVIVDNCDLPLTLDVGTVALSVFEDWPRCVLAPLTLAPTHPTYIISPGVDEISHMYNNS